MPTVKHFEDLHVWQSARELVRMVYADSGQMEFGRDFGLKDQIRRAAVSVMSNIAEGFTAGSDADFVRFLGFARRSNSEVQSQTYVALDLNYISDDRFKEIQDKANLLERQVNTLISYLAKSRHRTIKESPSAYTLTQPDQPAPLEKPLLPGLSDFSNLPDFSDLSAVTGQSDPSDKEDLSDLFDL
jgi:four helix bundle protein